MATPAATQTAPATQAPAAQAPAGPSPRERANTAEDLGKQGATAIPQLETMLADPDSEVRVAAVKSLVRIGTQASLEPLMRATKDNDPEVQIRATDGLVDFYLPGYVRTGLSATLRRAGTAIKGKWSDTNDEIIPVHVQVRPEVIQAFGELARGASSMEARANAAKAIGVLRGRAALDDLIAALRSKDDLVMFQSLIAIQKIRDPSAAPRISFLLRDLNERIQIAAIETTGLLRNSEALPQLRDALNGTRSSKVRRAALTAIAMIPEEGSRDLYLRYLNDKDDGMRAAAAEGLARLKNPADLPTMEKAFAKETKMNPRLSAAFAVVMQGKAEVSEFSPLQYLVNTLNSSMWKGVSRAFLVELARETPVRRALENAARRGTRDEKIELSYILSVSGDKESVAVLDALTRDPDTDVSGAALTGMKSLKARLP